MTKPARKRRLWLAAAIVVIVAVLFLAILFALGWRPGEPTHNGRRVSAWAQDLASGNPVIRSNAIIAIREMGPEAREHFVTMMGRSDPALKKPYSRVAPKLPGWIRRLGSGLLNPFRPGQQRYIAMEALVVLGTNAPAEALAVGLRDPEPGIALRASQALASLGPPALPYLLQAVDDTNQTVVALGCSALAQIGPGASNAIPRLITRLGDSQPVVFNTASTALQKMGPLAYPALCDALKNPDENLRRIAARTLGSIGALARSTGPCLLPTLLDPNPLVRLDAVLALGKVDPFSPESVMALAAALNDSIVSVRSAALGGLKRSSRLAAPAVPRLVPMLATPDSELRIQVLGILSNVGPAAGSEARAAVHQLTSDPDPAVREKAQTTLIRIDAPRAD